MNLCERTTGMLLLLLLAQWPVRRTDVRVAGLLMHCVPVLLAVTYWCGCHKVTLFVPCVRCSYLRWKWKEASIDAKRFLSFCWAQYRTLHLSRQWALAIDYSKTQHSLAIFVKCICFLRKWSSTSKEKVASVTGNKNESPCWHLKQVSVA